MEELCGVSKESAVCRIRFRQNAPIDPVRLMKVVAARPGASLVPPVSLKLNLDAPPDSVASGPAKGPDGRGAGSSPAPRSGPPDRPGRKAPAKPAAAPSWWTARATAGEVTGGFTKEEILRRPEADPRAEGGMFARIEDLLRALR